MEIEGQKCACLHGMEQEIRAAWKGVKGGVYVCGAGKQQGKYHYFLQRNFALLFSAYENKEPIY